MITIPPEMNCRENSFSPLTLLTEARTKFDGLARQYPMLTGNKSVIQIYSLIDGAIFKLQNNPVEDLGEGEIIGAGETPADDDMTEEERAEAAGPITGADLLKGAFAFLTSDSK